MIKRIAKALVLSIALLGASVSTASAAAPCTSGHLCWYTDADFVGYMFGNVTTPSANWIDVITSNDNTMSSYKNWTNYDAIWATGPSGTGTIYCINSQSVDSWVGDNQNDKLTSFMLLSTNGFC
ncbi:MAG: Peptidase inhibitor family [Actinomycetota bacterium]